jgi:hypothetical protein
MPPATVTAAPWKEILDQLVLLSRQLVTLCRHRRPASLPVRRAKLHENRPSQQSLATFAIISMAIYLILKVKSHYFNNY